MTNYAIYALTSYISKERICRQHPESITLLDIRVVGQNDSATQHCTPGIVHSLLECKKKCKVTVWNKFTHSIIIVNDKNILVSVFLNP